MNILDSQLVEGQLRAHGMNPVADYRDAGVILFNTCSVREHAEHKVISRLGRLRSFKRDNPDTIIGVIGCMAEREKEGVFAKAPHVDLLCGPGELNALPALIDEVRRRNERVTALAGSLSRRTEVLQRALEYDSLEALNLSRTPDLEGEVLQSYIRVQRGCDKFCTYCVVPFTRGAERSRPATHIVDEAVMLAERGCREITLLGQTVNSYVHQQGGRAVPFARLLERVSDVAGIDRIRFVTSYPADWDEDIFRVMRDHPRVMPYLHIPAQSGSDRMLRGMKRGYTVASYLELMDTARKYVPDIALAGDMIVGFCGESEADFRATVELARRVEYQNLFVFKYSPRPGTKADRNMTDDIPESVKQTRCNELLAVQAEIGAALRQRYVGRTVEVLVEGYSKLTRKARGHGKSELRTRGKSSHAMGRSRSATEQSASGNADRSAFANPQASEQERSSVAANVVPQSAPGETAQLLGRTRHDVIVLFDAPPAYRGALVTVQVESATPHTLFGRVIEVGSPPLAVKPRHDRGGVSLPVAPNAAVVSD